MTTLPLERADYRIAGPVFNSVADPKGHLVPDSKCITGVLGRLFTISKNVSERRFLDSGSANRLKEECSLK